MKPVLSFKVDLYDSARMNSWNVTKHNSRIIFPKMSYLYLKKVLYQPFASPRLNKGFQSTEGSMKHLISLIFPSAMTVTL